MPYNKNHYSKKVTFWDIFINIEKLFYVDYVLNDYIGRDN